MPLVNGHYEGEDARKIRAFTKKEVSKAIMRALKDSLGTNEGIAVLRSMKSASNSLQSGGKFVVAVPTEPKTSRCRVMGADNKAHSGMRFEWTFLLQMSNGEIGGNDTGDKEAKSDDVLVDAVRNGLENQYVYFRDTLVFENLRVEQADKVTTNGSALNPLTVTFSNRIRLENDSVLSI